MDARQDERSQSEHKVTKNKWSPEEDEMLKTAVEKYGTKNWVIVASMVPERTGKQCRERWVGQISPSISKEEWTIIEDLKLLTAQHSLGNKWSAISQVLPNRSPISIKNRWNWFLRNKNSIVLSNNHKAKVQTKQMHFEPISFNDTEIFGKDFYDFQLKLFSRSN